MPKAKYKSLLIVESPNKVNSISSYLKALGYKDIIVLPSYGHIVNLLSKKNAVNPDNNFSMIWTHTPQSSKALPKIIEAAKQSEELIVATDPDREGEAIGYHLIRELEQKKIKLPVKRMLFYAITKQAMKDAMENLQDMRENLISAYLSRLGLDFLVGFNVSPLLWRKLPGCASAGRVQSAALKVIVEQEYAIVQFKSKEYYVIKADFMQNEEKILEAKLVDIMGVDVKVEKGCIYEPKPEQLETILTLSKKNPYSIKKITKNKKVKNPQPPFITSTLQQEASSRLSLSPSMTMRLAQKLYEGVKIGKENQGLITYMRTDNVHMSKEALADCRSWIAKEHGEKYLHDTVRTHRSKVRNAQEAHECIRPTDFALTPDKARAYLDIQEHTLYSLIWKKAIASQMSSAEYEETNVQISNDHATFQTKGNVLLFDGFLKYGHIDSDQILPPLKEQQELNIDNICPEKKETKPPSRYTSASLIAKMEKLGIGRPSTYTRIVETLLTRDYVEKQQGFLTPTTKSWFLIAFLEKYFDEYIEYDFTAEMEEELDEVSNGKMKWDRLLQDFWKDFSQKVEKAQEGKYDDLQPFLEKRWHDLFFKDGNDKCAKCGAKAQVRFWKGGSFISCSQHPDCDWIRNIDQTQEPILFGVDPDTKQSIRILEGRYGPYLQWDDNEQHKKKRVGLPKALKPEAISMEMAQKMRQMPWKVGIHPETQEEVKVGFGKFGPYVLYQETFTSLKQDPFTATLDDCLVTLEEKAKKAKKIKRKTISKTSKVDKTTKITSTKAKNPKNKK